MKKHLFKIILGCIVCLLFVYLCVRNIDFTRAYNTLKNANLVLILVASVIYILSYLIRSIRWDYILAPLKKLQLFKSFYFLVFGFFMNNILPLRLGEFVRAIVAGKKLEITKSGVFATIVVERLMDIIIFILSFFLIGLFVNIPYRRTFIGFAIFFGIMLIVLFVMSNKEDKFASLIAKFHLPEKITQIIQSIFLKFASGLKFFQSNKLMFKVLVTSVIIWYVEAWAYKIFFLSFGLEVTLMQCLFVIVITGIGTMLPGAPAYIGAIEWFGAVALGVFGIEKSVAVSAMFGTHFAEMMIIYLLGIAGMIKEKITFSDLFKFAIDEENKK